MSENPNRKSGAWRDEAGLIHVYEGYDDDPPEEHEVVMAAWEFEKAARDVGYRVDWIGR